MIKLILAIIGAIILIGLSILGLAIHMSKYFENKLWDMNNCYGMECPDCEKYGKTCSGREKWSGKV